MRIFPAALFLLLASAAPALAEEPAPEATPAEAKKADAKAAPATPVAESSLDAAASPSAAKVTPLLAKPANPLPKSDRARVERYLTNIKTITSQFTQIAPDGALTSGQMFIKRPNKMRWVYDAPTPILMVTRGNFLTYYDYQLKQVSDIPLDSTMLGFFAMDNVRFGETVKVVKTEKAPGILRLGLRQSDNPKLGMLTLEFSDAPLTLRGFSMLDAQGKTTSVTLNNARFDEPLPDEVFEFVDPRTKGRQRQRSGTEAR